MRKANEDYEKLRNEKVSGEKRNNYIVMVLILGLIVGLASGYLLLYLAQLMSPQLVFAPVKTDQFTIDSCTFMPFSSQPNYTYVNMSIQNTGSMAWTITTPAQVNANTNVPVAYTAGAKSFTCLSGKTIYITLTPTSGFTSGNLYHITIVLSDGTKITYVATAP
jgi:hypothetical protein